MKKLLFTFMLFSAFSLAGCDDKNLGTDDTTDNKESNTPNIPDIIVSTNNVNLTFDEQWFSVEVSSNADLTFTISAEGRSWISLAGMQAMSTNTFLFQVAENSGFYERSATIDFTNIEADISETVTIVQDGTGTMESVFPDPIFRAYILENFDTDKDGKISKEEAEKVIIIEASKGYNNTPENEKIASLEGIQYFTNLTYLDCSYNKLTWLDVTQNTALETLYCYYNQLTELDVTQNLELKDLDCHRNQLKVLDVSHNTALIRLRCSYNFQLTTLDVSHNTALTELYCDGNYQLTTLDVSHNTALTILYCDSIYRLTALDVTQNSALEVLWCYSNQLTTLDVSHNTKLKDLDCSFNQLTTLDLSHNTALLVLTCYSNYLTTLDVSRTNLGNNNIMYSIPLDCSPMNGSGLETLYLKEGWEIKYIYPERDDDYVPANTEIKFKD